MTEEKEDLLEKWDFLLQDLSKSKTKLNKFARIYEKIVQNNRSEDVKILLPVAYKVFKQVDDIKMSNGKKNEKEIINFSIYDFYIEHTLMVDLITSFTDATAKMIVEALPKIEKFSHLQIQDQDDEKIIKVIFQKQLYFIYNIDRRSYVFYICCWVFFFVLYSWCNC